MPHKIDNNRRMPRAKLVGAKRPFKYNGEYLYAVTVTPNKRDRDYSRKDIIQNLKKLGGNKIINKVIRYAFEHKKDNTLHVHGIVTTRAPFKYTPRCKGWQWYLKAIPTMDDMYQWERYCYKNSEAEATELYKVYQFQD